MMRFVAPVVVTHPFAPVKPPIPPPLSPFSGLGIAATSTVSGQAGPVGQKPFVSARINAGSTVRAAVTRSGSSVVGIYHGAFVDGPTMVNHNGAGVGVSTGDINDPYYDVPDDTVAHGASVEAVTQSAFETDAGKTLALDLFSIGDQSSHPFWASNTSTATLKAKFAVCYARGMYPVLDASTYNIPLGDIAAGTYDTQITAFFQGMASFGKPWVLRMNVEMNSLNTYPYTFGKAWQAPTRAGHEADFIAAWRKMFNLAAAANANGNCTWHWAPNPVKPYDVGSSNYDYLVEYYPGDAYVDWAGFVCYQIPPSAGVSEGDWSYLSSTTYARISALTTKPIMLSEWGSYSEFTSAINGGVDTNSGLWYQHALDYIRLSQPQIKAVLVFNANDSGNDSSIEVNATRKTKYALGIGNAAYLGKQVSMATSGKLLAPSGGGGSSFVPLLPATINPRSTVTAAIVKPAVTSKQVIAATINALSTVSGADLKRLRRVVPASVSALSTVSGNATALKLVKPAIIAANGTVTGKVAGIRRVTGNVTAQSTVTGSITGRHVLVGAVISAASVTSLAIKILRGVVPTQITVLSTVSGAVVKRARISSGQVVATSFVSAAVLRLARVFPAQIAATSTVSGSLLRKGSLVVATVSGNSTVSLTRIPVLRRIAATANAVSTVSGRVSAIHKLSGLVVSAQSTMTAALILFPTKLVVPTVINARTTVSGAVTKQVRLVTAQISALGTIFATVGKLVPLLSTQVSATSVVSGTVLRRPKLFPSQIIATSNVSAGIVRVTAFGGISVTVVSTVSSAVTKQTGSLLAVVNAQSTVHGIVDISRAVATFRITGSSVVIADLTVALAQFPSADSEQLVVSLGLNAIAPVVLRAQMGD